MTATDSGFAPSGRLLAGLAVAAVALTAAVFFWGVRRTRARANPTAAALGWIGVAQALTPDSRPGLGRPPTLH